MRKKDGGVQQLNKFQIFCERKHFFPSLFLAFGLQAPLGKGGPQDGVHPGMRGTPQGPQTPFFGRWPASPTEKSGTGKATSPLPPSGRYSQTDSLHIYLGEGRAKNPVAAPMVTGRVAP